ncbi:zinc ribbon domain-containing protein [Niveibacterium sp. 24ML]|uniref:hypothetical protein n=1 Tax=Niveibacterium sp. 24ML TaxID=2985512 RepID=UPI002270C58F|nr:hypothetical protein [Niveibacterium sp. 24ML]MCX9158597.1 zinc ribbon domain-containing protein [Niveibacterium sp. 24ML]
MKTTIRDSLAKKKRLWLFSLVATCLPALVVAAQTPQPTPVSMAIVGGLLLCFVILGVAGQVFLRCPRCTRTIDPQFRLSHFNPINYCPYCGVSIDEPLHR